ncbi:DUF6064 family protein [Ramlibacter pallidus]|uniref:MFS transporter permease n=1 Tax=Ramlibacter pallidus TaxID=2780087 RepID=A0ABR9S861_9BURK|nr:DUF6064 family protein [Ramlibacter pallidus]MBE7369182.1 hypothetical protein [Ramlibacter pallidus]
MTEWWTYGLSDYLMFSPEAYWRLVARHNAAGGPARVAGRLAAFVLVLLVLRGRAAGTRIALILLAVGWACVAWSFHWQRYAEIFLAARWLAAAWGVQAALLLAAAARPSGGTPAPGGVRFAGAACLVAALLYPLLAPLTGHPWTEAEVFGWLPDPTALATLGALLSLAGMRTWVRAALLVVPALALAFGAATRWLLA